MHAATRIGLTASLMLALALPAEAAVTTYRSEADYLADLATFGFATFAEGFENDAAWGAARSPATQASVLSQGVTWTSNHAGLAISTSSGAARTGAWGAYSLPHGSYDGSASCNVPGNCGDGLAGSSATTLYGVGIWIYSNVGGGGKLGLELDGIAVNFANANFPHVTQSFFGAISTDGFSQFRFTELEGVNGDQVYVFFDDTTFAQPVPEPEIYAMMLAGFGLIGLAARRGRLRVA